MNYIAKKSIALLENIMTKQGVVLGVTAWNPATLFEVQLHLPDAPMEKWTNVPYMKCRVAPYVYRDYTPSLWNASARTCSLFVDAAHDGAGSQWVAGLKKGDAVTYVGPSASTHRPMPASRLLALGDSSSLGHFLALEQLAGLQQPVGGAIYLSEENHRRTLAGRVQTGLVSVGDVGKTAYEALAHWLAAQSLAGEVAYIAGHIPTTVQLRKLLKSRDDFAGKIYAHGFWS